MRAIKEDLVWPREWEFPFKLERVLKQWIQNCSSDFPHVSLGYLTPEKLEQKHQNPISALQLSTLD
ncbi:MAG: hypothetical protein BWY42_00139 [Candidatus Omnitrophica bacterium ADurb.Bin277]|nr:MAG: hypothetical protein BWY42_00139 [Candidatus Omnitrophica bacterium ADurb.Bin277]